MLGHEEPVSIRVHTQSDQARFAGVVLEVVPTRSRRSTGGRAPAGLPGLVGGSAADNFVFSDAAIINFINGGAGANTIDWSAYTTDLNVTLTATGAATGFNGSEPNR